MNHWLQLFPPLVINHYASWHLVYQCHLTTFRPPPPPLPPEILLYGLGSMYVLKTFNRVFFWIFYVLYSTLLHLPPLGFHCVGGCWD
jgi:hypothetical protein